METRIIIRLFSITNPTGAPATDLVFKFANVNDPSQTFDVLGSTVGDFQFGQDYSLTFGTV